MNSCGANPTPSPLRRTVAEVPGEANGVWDCAQADTVRLSAPAALAAWTNSRLVSISGPAPNFVDQRRPNLTPEI